MCARLPAGCFYTRVPHCGANEPLKTNASTWFSSCLTVDTSKRKFQNVAWSLPLSLFFFVCLTIMSQLHTLCKQLFFFNVTCPTHCFMALRVCKGLIPCFLQWLKIAVKSVSSFLLYVNFKSSWVWAAPSLVACEYTSEIWEVCSPFTSSVLHRF